MKNALQYISVMVLWFCVMPPNQSHAQALQTVAAGVQIEARVDADAKLATFTLKDASTGTPIASAKPAAWMQLRRSELAAEELSCQDKAMQFSKASLGSRADADLNTYRLVTLNEDSTIAFINPLVRLNNSRLEAIVQLPSKGYDWVLSRRTQRLFVSLRETGQIAVIDTLQRKLVKIIDIQADALPTRMVMDEDADMVWVGLDGRNNVLAIDAVSMQIKAQVDAASGLHTLEMVRQEPWLWVTNAQSDSVSIIHRTQLRKIADVPVGKNPVSVAWSVAARRAVVLSIADGTLAQVDPTSASVTQRIALERGVIQSALFDEGRYAIAINHSLHRASLIDLAASRVLDEVPVTQNPDQLLISRQFAYVRGQSSPHVTMLNLAQARSGKLSLSTVSLGRQAPGEDKAAVAPAAAMALAPEGNGIYLANAPDKTIYRYTEGLMAANGSFSNYKRAARGLMVLDTSLTQSEAGVFSASFALTHSGRYDIVVRNANPAFTACFVTQIDLPKPIAVAVRTPSPRLISIAPNADGYVFLLTLEPTAKYLPEDATLLLFAQHSGWQLRIPLEADAVTQALRARVRLPDGVQANEIQAMISVPSLALSFSSGYLGVFSEMLRQQASSSTAIQSEATR